LAGLSASLNGVSSFQVPALDRTVDELIVQLDYPDAFATHLVVLPEVVLKRHALSSQGDPPGGTVRSSWRVRDDTLKVSAKAEYACLALIALAQRRPDDRPVKLSEIARAQSIPQAMLTHVMADLRAAGFVQSARGSNGGYSLALPPEVINLKQVLKSIDGDNGPQRDLRGASASILASVWDRITELESQVLSQTSIAELAAQLPALDWAI
jgi:Rrf2 family protein